MIAKGYILNIFETIPVELTLREHPITVLVGISMFVSFVLIAMAKLLQSDVYRVLIESLFKGKQLYAFLRESFPVLKGGSILLLLNYLLSFSLLLLFVFQLLSVNISRVYLVIAVAPLVFLVFGIGSLALGMALTGVKNAFLTPILMKVNGAQLLGIYCAVLVFLWTLGFIHQSLFIALCFWGVGIENIVRLVRSFAFVLTTGVSWYYIIIYLCTLEILPLLVLYYFIAMNFSF